MNKHAGSSQNKVDKSYPQRAKGIHGEITATQTITLLQPLCAPLKIHYLTTHRSPCLIFTISIATHHRNLFGIPHSVCLHTHTQSDDSEKWAVPLVGEEYQERKKRNRRQSELRFPQPAMTHKHEGERKKRWLFWDGCYSNTISTRGREPTGVFPWQCPVCVCVCVYMGKYHMPQSRLHLCEELCFKFVLFIKTWWHTLPPTCLFHKVDFYTILEFKRRCRKHLSQVGSCPCNYYGVYEKNTFVKT